MGNKAKKSWGERLKLGGKPDKKREERSPTSPVSPDNSYLLEEYRNKYGTLSSGSALSKSMKYAETWLYGSVAVRPTSKDSNPRPSLLLYHHVPPPVAVIPTAQAVVFPPAAKYAVVVCSCPEFITGTARSKKSSSAACKKCGGSRTFWNVNKAGTVRGMPSTATANGTIRVGTVGHGQHRVRPSLLNMTPLQKPESSKTVQKATTPDPYDLMRRNRLGVVNNDTQARFEVLETCGLDTLRIRAKSTSPCRRRRSPSPPTSGSVVERSGVRTSRKDLRWDREYPRWNSAVISPDNNGKRKSILECDVNAYELIAKYLKNGNKAPKLTKESSKANEPERTLSDDDILEDDLSDDLSDNALENASSARRNVKFSTFHSKTENGKFLEGRVNTNSANNKIAVEKCSSPTVRPTGITLGGQRIKIFNESIQSHTNVDNQVNDESPEENNNESSGKQLPKNTNTSPSLIPRLASPRRPPRKLKSAVETGGNVNGETTHESGENENESTVLCGGDNVRSPSPSILTQTRDARYSSTAEGAIKSILKKPTLSPGDTTTFSDTVSRTSAAACHSPSPDARGEFYLPTFQEFKQKIKKKKQVQFKVTDEVAVLGPLIEEEDVDTPSLTRDSSQVASENTVGNVQDNSCCEQDEELPRDNITTQEEKQLNVTVETPLVVETANSNVDADSDRVETGDVDRRSDVKHSVDGDVNVKTEINENGAKDCNDNPENTAVPDLLGPQDGIENAVSPPTSSDGEYNFAFHLIIFLSY